MKDSFFKSFQLENATLKVGSGLELFKNATAEIPTGQVVWIRGLSGSGKSTFLKLLVGLVHPSSGDFRINGYSTQNFSFEEFLPYRRQIGYSFDFGGLLNNRTIFENLALPLLYHENLEPEAAAERLKPLMEAFQLTGSAHLRPSAVVGGVRKATCVARAFVMNPEMLLLDDPTVGLRADVKRQFKKKVQSEIQSQRARHIFVVSDDMDFIGDIFDHVVSIEDGVLSSFSASEWRMKNAG